MDTLNSQLKVHINKAIDRSFDHASLGVENAKAILRQAESYMAYMKMVTACDHDFHPMVEPDDSGYPRYKCFKCQFSLVIL
jgi:hypothetical protein